MNIDENFLILPGYDDCIIGVGVRFGQEPIVMYDYQKVIDKLVVDGCTEDEAVEYFEFNMIGAWVGDTTPGYVITNYTLEEPD